MDNEYFISRSNVLPRLASVRAGIHTFKQLSITLHFVVQYIIIVSNNEVYQINTGFLVTKIIYLLLEHVTVKPAKKNVKEIGIKSLL